MKRKGKFSNRPERLSLRQGDVLLVPIGTPYVLANPVPRKKGEGIIVAAGELTGHHHRIRSRHARMYRDHGRTHIRVHNCDVKDRPQLTHEEHDPITLEPGWYSVVMQREYVAESRTRRVYD